MADTHMTLRGPCNQDRWTAQQKTLYEGCCNPYVGTVRSYVCIKAQTSRIKRVRATLIKVHR